MDVASTLPCHAVETAVSPFHSFWQGGFEGADHVNPSGTSLCMQTCTGHLARIDEDYRRAAALGIRTVRESVGWRRAERDGGFDFACVAARERAARSHGIQILWTLWHYGIPGDVDLFSDELPSRFARFCGAFARFLCSLGGEDLARVHTPINEISFLSWAVCRDDLPRGYELKKCLVAADLAGCRAIRAVDPRARFLHVDPLIHVVAPAEQPELAAAAAEAEAYQYQAWDMLAGLSEPQLGGAPHWLDLVGVNYYHANQWEFGSDERLAWHLGDPRRRAFADMLAEAYARYRRPMAVSETSHVGSGRAQWLDEIAAEVERAQQHGTPVTGICLYPLIDRPDWDQPRVWHHSGLWDIDPADSALTRHLEARYANALARAQARLPHAPRRPAPAGRSSASAAGTFMHTLIVFSHLRWNFVYQRPQHLLQRLARHYHVLFVEEPVFDAAGPWAETDSPAPNVRVLRVHSPLTAAGFHDDHVKIIAALLQEELQREGIDDYSAWLYTPQALPLLNGLHPCAVIYDCMDELSAFLGAPAQLHAREATLYQLANVVLAGGPSLYEARRIRHPHVHCLPSSVDVEHFGRARDRSRPHPDLAALPRPRLGYVGVIDERVDLDLLAALAAAHPDWQLCMVGPVVKIDPAQLPRSPNIHYLGQREYADLPRFLAGWDVCLLPFALNASTRFISPTKTLEYMAAELPVVSTRIADVAALYGEGVAVADDAPAFIAACAAALSEDGAAREHRVAAQRRLTSATSWDKAADRVHALIEQARTRGLTPEALSFFEGERVLQLPVPARRDKANAETACAILGAGPTGLSAAYHLGADSLLIERNPRVGGWCRSIEHDGFQFDHAGHIMFSNDPWVHSMYRLLLGDNVHWQDREAWIYSKGVYTRYPFQGALHGLPPEVLKECLVGAIEARFGSLHPPKPDGGVLHVMKTAPAANAEDCCGDGLTAALACTAAGAPAATSDNFEAFIYRTWGTGVAKHFAIPYNRKLWTVPLSEMETSWLGGRVPLPDLEAMIEGALQPVPKPMGPNARFGYPLRGGFQALMNGFLPHLHGELWLDSDVVRVQPAAHRVQLADGRVVRYRSLISTLPLPELVRAIGEEAPAQVRAAAQALRHVSVRCVNLGIGRERITDKHWIYYPEDTVFHRIFVQGNASPHCSPPDGFGLTCEITYSPSKPLPVDGDALVRRCMEDCVRVGLLRADDALISSSQADMPYAYVVYDHARAAHVATLRTWLAEHDIVLAGRYSEWAYYNSDHAFLAGRRAAETVRAAQLADCCAPA